MDPSVSINFQVNNANDEENSIQAIAEIKAMYEKNHTSMKKNNKIDKNKITKQ